MPSTSRIWIYLFILLIVILFLWLVSKYINPFIDTSSRRIVESLTVP